ncbi:MAG: hypothetical protein JXB30_13260 [Anaerolineae bacterium]|nr:hypothetical protein [Anaerolineae bacterium]
MISLGLHYSLDDWLTRATQGFPDEAQQRIREEIEDHYWSGISYYQAMGKSEEEACRSAIADLGDVRDARRAFYDTYASKWSYLLTGILSIMLPLVFAVLFRREPELLIGGGPFKATLTGLFCLLQFILLGLPTFTIIYSGYGLLTHRFHFAIGRWRVGLLVLGLTLTFLPDCLNAIWLLATGQGFFVETYIHGIPSIQKIISCAGAFLFSSGLILMGHHLGKLRYSLYGMQPALIVSAWIWGLSQACMALLQSAGRTSSLIFTLVLSSTAFCTFLGWMFVKAAYRGLPPLPIPGMSRSGGTT